MYYKYIIACFSHYAGVPGPHLTADASGILILSTSLLQGLEAYMTIFHSSDIETNDFTTGRVLGEVLWYDHLDDILVSMLQRAQYSLTQSDGLDFIVAAVHVSFHG